MELAKVRQRFETDADAESHGTYVHLGDGFYVKVARAGNPVAKKIFDDLVSDPKVDMERRAGALSDDKINEIMLEVQSRAILVGWKGLTDNGVEVPYSVAKAKELLLMQDFRDRVVEISKTQELYRVKFVEEAAVKLGK